MFHLLLCLVLLRHAFDYFTSFCNLLNFKLFKSVFSSYIIVSFQLSSLFSYSPQSKDPKFNFNSSLISTPVFNCYHSELFIVLSTPFTLICSRDGFEFKTEIPERYAVTQALHFLGLQISNYRYSW